MQEMTPQEIQTFLLSKARTAKVATVLADGRPHIAPVWFDLDGEKLVFTTWHTAAKARNMRRDPRICICVDEEIPPFTFVQIQGTVEFSTDPQELRRWATRIAGRYMGADAAEAYGERNGVEGELLVTVTPTHIVARKNISD